MRVLTAASSAWAWLALVSQLAAAKDKDEDKKDDGRLKDSGTIWATPHDSYSSSVGVLGCKIDTDRVAYWPQPVDCDNICVELSYQDRTVKLLRIDQSQGAYDVSYDAWNYLYTGHSATDKPTAGGGVEMEYKQLKPSDCKSHINTKGSKLPLSAANSMNFLASCLDSDTWIGNNYRLFNVADAICSMGHDEECDIDWPEANQAECDHTLGDNPQLKDAPVYNIRYPSGEKVLASTGEPADDAGPSVRKLPGLLLCVLSLVAVAVYH